MVAWRGQAANFKSNADRQLHRGYRAECAAFDFVELTWKHMLRINPSDSSNHHVILRLEGRVAGPWVIELWKACEKVLSDGQVLELNLADVSFVDPAGVALLTRVRTRGVQLADCSPFLKEQLKAT